MSVGVLAPLPGTEQGVAGGAVNLAHDLKNFGYKMSGGKNHTSEDLSDRFSLRLSIKPRCAR